MPTTQSNGSSSHSASVHPPALRTESSDKTLTARTADSTAESQAGPLTPRGLERRWRDLKKLFARRLDVQKQCEIVLDGRINAAEEQFRRKSTALEQQHVAQQNANQKQYLELLDKIQKDEQARWVAFEKEFRELERQLKAKHAAEVNSLAGKRRHEQWELRTRYDGNEPEPQIRYQQAVRQLELQSEQHAGAYRATSAYLKTVRQRYVGDELIVPLDERIVFPQDETPAEKKVKAKNKETIRIHDEGPPRNFEFSTLPDLPDPETPPTRSLGEISAKVRTSLETTVADSQAIEARWGLKLLRNGLPWLWLLTPTVLIGAATWWLAGGDLDAARPAGIAAGATFFVALIALIVVRQRAKARLVAELPQWYQRRADLLVDLFDLGRWAHHQMRRDQLDMRAKYEQNLRAIGERFLNESNKLQETQRNETLKMQERRAKKLQDITDHFVNERETLEKKFEPSFEALRRALDRGLAAAEQERAKVVDATRAERAKTWREFVSFWNAEHARLKGEFAAADEEFARLFPAWRAPSWEHWTPPDDAPRKMPLGEVAMDVRGAIRDFSPHAELPFELPTRWNQPALIDFPRAGSLVIQADGAGREQGLKVLQALALRLLTSLPAGKARFTIIDPVGLGKNFAGMMHLADYDDALVTNRIWTETQHIEQRLLDLSEQIEVIIQKYLRNEYSSIDEYNAIAGEVAEPFRFLIVANFPRNFTEAAARRLLSIAASGPRCGVYVLLMADVEQKMPAGFSLQDLAKYADSLIWEKDRFVWRDEVFGAQPFTPLAAPDDDVVTALVHKVGEASKDAKRVEVPFTTICPTPDKYWTGSTQASFDIALGRAGARKLQYMRLGYGTSQHVLIAGKTGSGKSSLLHALIVNAALTYSPDELEFYLIDFKKGVEFKDYAIFGLPHARVIAIESEREFGLSVLQRLDTEMQARGELFRAAGKQDLNGYRGGEGAQPLPRILLVIDEFQEFFTEEDRVSQAATLLLDRLVRQGRAFGIHLLLGSQTLGGAYSLARSTISQMAVRIALQCSESDAELILTDGNSAARLLSRPGEAIYNDANGRLEGNSPFQVSWITEAQREDALREIRKLADERISAHGATIAVEDRLATADWSTRRKIVFEGNAAADLAGNRALEHWRKLPDASVPHDARRPINVWLGDPVSIKDPTVATLSRQPAANILILGQAIEPAQNLLGAALTAFAAQRTFTIPPTRAERLVDDDPTAPPPAKPGAWILEATAADAGGTTESAPKLVELAAALELPHVAVGRRELPDRFAELAAEVERRTAGLIDDAAPIVLMIHNLSRFRDLKRDENDLGFSFSSSPAKSSPDKDFVKILREGPAVGVHTLVWCDTLANLLRSVERSTLREFDMRVLFQMNPGDSSQMVDGPAASRLGRHFALYSHEESGTLEKFRPYAWPNVTGKAFPTATTET